MREKIENILGVKRNKLTAINVIYTNGRNKLECKCDCGRNTIIRKDSFGKNMSCDSCAKVGPKPRYGIGNRFGKLVIFEDLPLKDKCGILFKNCRCDCGNTRVVVLSNLTRGVTTNCGCSKLLPITTLPIGEAAVNKIIRMYKNNAKKHGRNFLLSKEFFLNIIKQDCFYCGKSPSNCCKANNGDCFYSGIDRVDNRLDYIESNVVPCCRQCNAAKLKYSKEEFFVWIKNVYFKHFGD